MPSQSQARGQLIVMNGPDRGLDYMIPVGRFELGRSPAAAIPLNDLNVSRQHAVLESTDQRVVLIDLGSVNGTWVNNRRLNGPCPLRDGDVVGLGAVSLQFRSAMAESAAGESAGWAELGAGPVAFQDDEPLRPRSRRPGLDGVDQVLMILGYCLALVGLGMAAYCVYYVFSTGPKNVWAVLDPEFLPRVPLFLAGLVGILGGRILAGIGAGLSAAARQRARLRRIIPMVLPPLPRHHV